MKKKKNPKSNEAQPTVRLAPQVNNPFQHIPFAAVDLNAINSAGGMSKELVSVDRTYRLALAGELDIAAETIYNEIQPYPHMLGALIFKLRSEGIAKSHRPLALLEEAGLVPAGHDRVEEMIVAADAGSLGLLKNIIVNRDIQKIRANLSVIERIEPWSRARRNPEGTLAIRKRGSALLRLFRYTNEDANEKLIASIKQLLTRLKLEHKLLPKQRGGQLFNLSKLQGISESAFDELLSHPGVRLFFAEPVYIPLVGAHHVLGFQPVSNSMPLPIAGLPTVAVFDTGVSSNAIQLNSWVVGKDTYVLPPETNYEHGTAVSSLVAGARVFNAQNKSLPILGSLIYDVCGLESSGSNMSDLQLRLREAVKKRPDVKIWNLSFGGTVPCNEQTFSEFAMALDQLSDEYDVLFVVAAGNYTDEPRRNWPNQVALQDRISSPAESVRALTVGSICHSSSPDGFGVEGEPAPYSRRGPGPVFTPKPDIVHIGGGVHMPWKAGAASMNVLAVDNGVACGFGTSYAAPIASSMAAHTWQALAGRPNLVPRPALVKALLIHAAQLSSPHYNPSERRYFGTGLPMDVMDSLYDRPDSFTLVFEAQLVTGRQRWRKAPYPIPQALCRNGKFCGEVIITAAYAPPLDPAAGSEYVRANVELSFGVLDGDSIKGKVPMQGEQGSDGYEATQVEHGGKWAPIKVHRRSFPQGIAGDDWALQARAYLRAVEPALVESLQVYIVCTLRALDGNPQVHTDGLQALATTNWVRQNLPIHIPIQV